MNFNINQLYFLFKTLILLLIILGFISSIYVGFSWDEYFHHINGLVRFKFLSSFGSFEGYQFRNNQYYPGLYDTISYALTHIVFIFDKKTFINLLPQLMHGINFVFSLLSVLGLYLVVKKVFNSNIAIISSLITLLNPFFFGHMGMNSKDIIIFFSLIWFSYFFYKYCTQEKKIIKNLILFSFFVGFGCGVRLTFPVVIFPIILSGIFYLYLKYKDNYKNFFKRIIPHAIVSILIVSFMIISCWPHMLIEIKEGNFISFFSTIIERTINWNEGPKTSIINGDFYLVFNTPRTYFLNIFIYRLPIYSSLLLAITYLLFFSKKLEIKYLIKDFNHKFVILNSIAWFPIILAILLKVNIYDNLRLFLFILPLFSILSAISFEHILNKYKYSLNYKMLFLVIVFFFSISFYRFMVLTPYQYTYVNYSYPILKDSIGKFEHDYWGVTHKELVNKIKEKYSKEEISKFKIADCGGGDFTLLYHLNKTLGIKKTYSDIDALKSNEPTHIVMNNRTFLDIFSNPYVKNLVNQKDGSMRTIDLFKVYNAPNINQMCFDYYGFKGQDEIVVNRNGLILSIFRKIEK